MKSLAAARFVNCRITLASALFEAGLSRAHAEAEQICQLLPGATSRDFSNLFAGALQDRRTVIALASGLHRRADARALGVASR